MPAKPRCEWCGGPCNRHGAQYCCRRHRADAERSRQHGAVLAAYVALGRNLPRLAQTLSVSMRRARQLVEAAERAQKREQARPEPVREIRSRSAAHTGEPGAARPACPYCDQALQLDHVGEWHCPPGPGHPFTFRPLKPGERPGWLPTWGSLGRKGTGGSGNKSRQKSAVQQRMDAWRRRRQTGE